MLLLALLAALVCSTQFNSRLLEIKVFMAFTIKSDEHYFLFSCIFNVYSCNVTCNI